MKYRTLGDSGLTVSEIGFGTWGIGGTAYGRSDDNESKKALRAALEKGITFYDSADLYGDGHAEELLGEMFSGSDRDSIIITTKGGTLPHTTFVMPQDFSAEYIQGAIERSLRRLRTDYIDLYLLHSPRLDDIIADDEVLDILETSKASGKIKYYGISARTPEDAVRAIKQFGFNIVEANFNLIDQRALECGLFDLARDKNVGLIIRTPLTFGYLTGTLRGDESLEGGDHRANWPKEQLQRWAEAHHLFSFLCEEKNCTPAQAALRFCLDFDAVSTVIPGMLKVSEVAENCAACDIPRFDVEVISKVYEIYKKYDFYDETAKQ